MEFNLNENTFYIRINNTPILSNKCFKYLILLNFVTKTYLNKNNKGQYAYNHVMNKMY